MAGNLFDLFDDSLKSGKSLVPSAPMSLADLSSSLGDSSAVTKKIDLTREVVPLVDYSDFKNFVFFNSALDYFNISGERILNEYPLTGSYSDYLGFISGSDPYQRYLLDVWPKSSTSSFGEPAPIFSLADTTLQEFIKVQQDAASAYDRGNSNLITNLVPARYLELEDELESKILKHLLFLMGRQFDEIKVKIDQFTKVFQVNYTDFDQAPDALLSDALSFWGWKTKGNFLSADAFQYLFGMNVTGADKLDQELYEIKNEFWRRTLQNLPHLYKTKGTRESVESLLRIYGLDEKIVKLKEYGTQLHSKIQTHRINSEKNAWAITLTSGSRVTSAPFAFTNTSTFEATFRLPSVDQLSATGSLFYTTQNSASEELWLYRPTSGTTGQAKWVCSVSGNPQQSVSFDNLPIFDGQWYHVAIKRSGSYAEGHFSHLDEDRIDWEYVASGTIDNRYVSGNMYFGLGGINNPSEGLVSNAQAWNTLLSASEVQDHTLNLFSHGVSTPDRMSNLVLKWQIDETTAASGVFDSSANNVTGSVASGTYSQFLFEYNFIAPPDWGWNEEKIRVSKTNKVNSLDKFAESNAVSLEFNLVDALNEDISCIISSLDHWNNLIGESANRHRETYHNVDALRKQYFTRLTGRLNFRVFADFLDFFDRAFVDLVKKLIPARARFKGAEFVVESHMLERPKAQYTYRRHDPRFEPEGMIRMVSPYRPLPENVNVPFEERVPPAPLTSPRRYYLTTTKSGAAPTSTFSDGNSNGATSTIISVDPRLLSEVKPGGAGTNGYFSVSSFATGRRKFAWDVWALELPAGVNNIAAQQWKFACSTRQPGALGFLVNEIALYVVRNGALYGKIYDSTAGSSGPSLPATVANQPQADVITFNGAALSGLLAGDRLYLEVWSDWTLPGIAAGGYVYFYWGGNDEPVTENEVTTTSVAAYLDCESM